MLQGCLETICRNNSREPWGFFSYHNKHYGALPDMAPLQWAKGMLPSLVALCEGKSSCFLSYPRKPWGFEVGQWPWLDTHQDILASQGVIIQPLSSRPRKRPTRSQDTEEAIRNPWRKPYMIWRLGGSKTYWADEVAKFWVGDRKVSCGSIFKQGASTFLLNLELVCTIGTLKHPLPRCCSQYTGSYFGSLSLMVCKEKIPLLKLYWQVALQFSLYGFCSGLSRSLVDLKLI